MQTKKIILIVIILLIIGGGIISLGLSIPTSTLVFEGIGFSHNGPYSLYIPTLILLIPMSSLFVGIIYKYFSRIYTYFAGMFVTAAIFIQIFMGYSSFFFPAISAGMYSDENIICTKNGWCDLEKNKDTMVCEILHNGEWREKFQNLRNDDYANAYANARKNCSITKTELSQVELIYLKRGDIEISHVRRTNYSYGYQTKNGIFFEAYSEPRYVHYNDHQINWILWKMEGY